MRRVDVEAESAAWVRFRKKRERMAAAVPVVRSMRRRGRDDEDEDEEEDEGWWWCDDEDEADEDAVLICVGCIVGGLCEVTSGVMMVWCLGASARWVRLVNVMDWGRRGCFEVLDAS